MALIQVLNVIVQNNPAPFLSSFQFLITFDCHPPGLREELEWKLIYVGSADDETLDQELDSVLVGPVAVGKNQFLFSAPPPNHTRIPEKDLLDVTVILLTCSYREKEFIRIGYYVNNEYIDDQYQAQLKAAIEANNAAAAAAAVAAKQSPAAPTSSSSSASAPPTASPLPAPLPLPLPPSPIDIRKVARNIAVDRPVITCFNIPWDSEDVKMPELSEEERKKLENERKENEIQAFREAEERAAARAKGQMNGSAEQKEVTINGSEERKEAEEAEAEDEEEEEEDEEEEKEVDSTVDVDLEQEEDGAEENGDEEQGDDDDGNDMEISVKK